MKIYTIPHGTTGKVITQCQDAPTASVEDWITRRELTFTESVVDPISHHNNRGNPNVPEYLKRYAEQGYAIYGGSVGNDVAATYLFAVQYDKVLVS